MNIKELTIKKAQAEMKAGIFTSIDLTKACLEEIKKSNKDINAFLTVVEEEALHDAKLADERRKNGEKGDLLGIPFAAKDVLMTKNIRTTAGSKILENYIAPFDATVIKKLKEAGAILVGKVNCDEFGHGSSGENSAYGPTKNPWDTTRVSGGSSSGSGAALSAGMCLFSLGTDTGGSTRSPASFCNLVGLKPTYGRNSRFGLMSMTSSNDVVGVLTKTVEDNAMVEKIIAGKDEKDATSLNKEVPNYGKSLEKDLSGLKIGLPEEVLKDAGENIQNKIKEALEELKVLGVEVLPVSLPHAKYGIPVYYIVTPSELSSNLAKLDGIRYGLSEQEKEIKNIYLKTRGKGFGAEPKRRIMIGTYALSAGYYDAYYVKAQKVRTKIKEEIDESLEKVDAIIMPTTPDVAFKVGEQVDDPIKMYLEDMFMMTASLSGLPAISIPCGFISDMPIGMQIIGKRFDEEMLFRIGHNYQKITDWHSKTPNF